MKIKRIFTYLLGSIILLSGGCLGSDEIINPDANEEIIDDEYEWDNPEIPTDEGDPGDDELIPNTQELTDLDHPV